MLIRTVIIDAKQAILFISLLRLILIFSCASATYSAIVSFHHTKVNTVFCGFRTIFVAHLRTQFVFTCSAIVPAVLVLAVVLVVAIVLVVVLAIVLVLAIAIVLVVVLAIAIVLVVVLAIWVLL